MRIRNLSIALALVAGLGIAGRPALAHEPAAASQRATSDVNRAFIDLMVPHHQSGIEMADEAIAKGTHAELKAFAQRMKASQSKDIDQLKAWRQSWFGSATTPKPMPMAPIPGGADFDRKWMMSLIDHHQNAIDMATLSLGSSSRSEIKGMAQRVVSSQRKEQAQLRTWLKAWYAK